MKAPTRKQAKAAALQLHSLIVRANGNGCAAAGVLPGECGPGRQCAHIIPKRQNSWVATDPDNGWVLCPGHHRMVDADPVRWLRLVRATIGVEWVLLMQDACDVAREGRGVSPLMWWRREVLDLLWVAGDYGADISQIPLHVRQWAIQQQANEGASE